MTIESLCWWAKTPHKLQRRPENAENQPDFCMVKEKIMKNNRPEPRGPRRIPARPDEGTEDPVLFFEALLILTQKPVKIVKENPVEDGAFWMPGTIDSCHSRSNTSRNGPILYRKG
jgi:hypothetical protein